MGSPDVPPPPVPEPYRKAESTPEKATVSATGASDLKFKLPIFGKK